ncbi:MAG: acyl-CoA dehydrogenase family protein [Candidatus Obscuribacterales bacterium]|nr:acyl-CoA dehydrogenase family protein [Candidatus Obscuribacterales bacterium]
MITSPTFQDVDDRRLSYLSESQRGWLKKARDFANRLTLEDVIQSDKTNVFRRDLFEQACKEGLGALPFGAKYGGSGGDYLSFCLVNEEFGRRCVPIMSSLGVHVLCQEPVYRFGTDSQKEKYLTKSSTGQYLAAFGLTEPGAGSDTAALACKAKVSGDNFILNGTKVFITSGAASDYFIVMARLTENDKDHGITAFIVEKDFPGCKIGQKFDMLGMRGYATCELVFEDCLVPRANLLGEFGAGRKVALSSLAKGRITIAAQATGWAQGALDAAVRILHETFGSSSATESRMALLGEMALQVEASRVLTYQAACAVDRGEGDITLAAMAKIHATDTAMKVSTDALSLTGLIGARPDYLLERIFRDAKAGQIYEGTNQIQRMLIARDLLKK